MSAVTAISLNGDISRDTGEGKSTAIDVQLCVFHYFCISHAPLYPCFAGPVAEIASRSEWSAWPLLFRNGNAVITVVEFLLLWRLDGCLNAQSEQSVLVPHQSEAVEGLTCEAIDDVGCETIPVHHADASRIKACGMTPTL